jgi:hypothetical protein
MVVALSVPFFTKKIQKAKIEKIRNGRIVFVHSDFYFMFIFLRISFGMAFRLTIMFMVL